MRRRLVSSDHNPDVRRLLALRDKRSERYSERCFIVEGPRFVFDAIRRQIPELLVVSESAEETLSLPADIDRLIVTDAIFSKISDTESPQGLIGVFAFPEHRETLHRTTLWIIADGIQDPGNLGTIIRSSAGLGATAVIAGSGTVDPYSPKVVRSAAGGHFEIAVAVSDRLDLELGDLQLVLADGGGEIRPDQIDWTIPTALVIGSEAHGVSAPFFALPHIAVAIPMAPGIESLNAGVAASILLYEADRQRRIATI